MHDRIQSAGDSVHAQRPPRLQLHAREPHGGRLCHHERAARGAPAVRRHAARTLQGPGGGGLRGPQSGVGLLVAGLQGHVHQWPEGVRHGAGVHRGDPSQGESDGAASQIDVFLFSLLDTRARGYLM